MADSRTRAELGLRAREREAKVIELKTRGATFAQIAKALGVSEGLASRIYRRGMSRIPFQPAGEARKAQLLVIDQIKLTLNGKMAELDKLDATPENVSAIARCSLAILRLEQWQAALLGLDSPANLKDGASERNTLTQLRAITRIFDECEAREREAKTARAKAWQDGEVSMETATRVTKSQQSVTAQAGIEDLYAARKLLDEQNDAVMAQQLGIRR